MKTRIVGLIVPALFSLPAAARDRAAIALGGTVVGGVGESSISPGVEGSLRVPWTDHWSAELSTGGWTAANANRNGWSEVAWALSPAFTGGFSSGVKLPDEELPWQWSWRVALGPALRLRTDPIAGARWQAGGLAGASLLWATGRRAVTLEAGLRLLVTEDDQRWWGQLGASYAFF